MKIGILGGSYDPPHFGHLWLARQVKEIVSLDQVLLMPVFSHPFNKQISSPADRLAMTKMFDEKEVFTSSWEIDEGKISYSIDTLNALSKKNPGNQYYWIVSSDQLEKFPLWKNWQEIFTRHRLIVFPRETKGKALSALLLKSLNLKKCPENIIVIQEENLISTSLSSTKIRERVKNGLSIDHFTLPKVVEYIRNRGLYK